MRSCTTLINILALLGTVRVRPVKPEPQSLQLSVAMIRPLAHGSRSLTMRRETMCGFARRPLCGGNVPMPDSTTIGCTDIERILAACFFYGTGVR